MKDRTMDNVQNCVSFKVPYEYVISASCAHAHGNLNDRQDDG
jgi:hypothetical protein